MRREDRKKILSVLVIIFITLFSLQIFAAQVQSAQNPVQPKNKDIFIVIDTSKSMKGIGPTAKRLGMGDISGKVIASAKKFIADLKPGDSLTIITFSTTTKFYPTVKLSVPADREKLLNILSAIRFDGNDTYTSKMIKSIEEKVRTLEAQDVTKKRSRVVVIMSDGLDDPPATSQEERFTLSTDPRVKRPAGSLFIYYLHLSPKPVSEEQRQRIEQLRQGREGSTTVTQADPSHGREQVIERAADQTRQNITEDTARRTSGKAGIMGFIKANWWWLLIVLLAVIALVFFVLVPLLGGKKGGKKPKRYLVGYIVYSDKKSNVKEQNDYNLAKVKRGYVKIGSSREDDIVLRGIHNFEGIKIYGNKTGGRDGFDIDEADLKKINVIQQKKEGVLSYDDIFEVQNYSFSIKQKI